MLWRLWYGVRASDVFGPCKFYDVTYATADTVWAVGLGDEFDSIFATFFKSTDGGFSYDIHAYQLCIPPYCMVEYTPRAISFGDPNHGVAVGNLGIVWTIRDPYVSEVASGTSKQLWGVSMPDSMTAVAVGDSGTIIVSTNGGDSWTPQVSGVSENLYAVSFVTPFIGTAVGAWGTILRTTDGGTTWIPQVSGTTAWLHGVDFLDKNNGVVVGAAIALVTTDGGVNWTVEQVPTTSRLNDVALMPGRTVAVGNGQVILNRKYSLVGTQRPPTISFQLYQNHPNPFNPSTTIRYDLPKPARVVLRIYDVKGRLVRTLLSPTWKEAGQHTELWDGLNNRGDHVASGIYFYRLTAGNRSLAKKMVLLR